MTENVEQANPTLPSGTMISGYRIERELGRGAMSVVYLAQQLDLQRPVALKILAAELAADKEFVKRFFNEARAAASLSHPNIIQAYDAGIADGDIYFFCMEFVEGETLLERLEREQRLPIEQSLKIAWEVASALNYGFQRAKFTHGDIKPDNIILNQLDQAKLADFGLAKVEGHDFDGSEIMLTPLYASPELIRGEHRPGDCRSDIYAFGATIYHLIAGSPPFPGTVASEVLDRHMHENPEPLRLRHPRTPLGLSDFIGRMLSKTPEQRPQNWEEVLNNLRQCQQYLVHTGSSGNPARVKKPLFIKPGAADPVVANSSLAPNSPAAGANASLRPRPRSRLSFSPLTYLTLATLLLVVCLAAMLLWRRTSSAAATSSSSTAPPAITAVEQSSVLPEPQSGASSADALVEQQNIAADGKSSTNHNNLNVPKTADDIVDTEVLNNEPGQNNLADQNDKHLAGNEAGQPEIVIPDQEDKENAATVVIEQPQFSLRLPPLGIPLQLSAEQLTQETWIEAAQCLAQLSYDLNRPMPVETMMRGVKEWLQNQPTDNEAVNFMRFIQETALPALEEMNVKIVQNKEIIIGQIFRNRRRETVSVAGVTHAGLNVDKLLADGKGKYQQRMSWEQAKNEGLLEEIGRKVFLSPRASLMQMRPFLSYLAFTGRSQEITRLLQHQNDISPEYRHWAMLPKIETWANKIEADALKTWRRLQAACKNGNGPAAHDLASRLRRSNTTIAGLYNRQLDELVHQYAPTLPQNQAGELLRQAQSAMQQHSPAAALTALLLAQARFGQIDYPEKSGLETRLEAVLESLPTAEWLNNNDFEVNRWLPFSPLRPQASWPAWSFIACREAMAQENLRPARKADLEQIADWAQLELGNWQYAWNKLGKKQPDQQLQTDAKARAAALFGAGLLQERFGNDEQKTEAILSQLFSEAVADRGAVRLEKLSQAFRLAVLTRQCRRLATTEFWQQPPDFTPAGSPAAALLASLFITAAFEADNNQLAITTLTELSSQRPDFFAGLPLANFSEAASLSGQQLSLSSFAEPPSVHLLRLTLSLCGASSLAFFSDSSFMDLVANHSSGWPFDGGELIFSWLLRRCGDFLAVGDLASADEMIDWCLSLPSSCLYPYYSRLHFLRAGLHLLCGSSGALESGATYVNAATVSSETEKKLFLALSRHNPSDAFPARLSSSHPSQFWLHWLLLCSRVNSDTADFSTDFSSWSAHSRTVAEQHFQSSFATYIRHLSSGSH